MARRYWVKFEWDPWRNDPLLRRCSKETRGFWIDCIAAMEDESERTQTSVYEIEGSPDEICRIVTCTREEFDRSVAELRRTNAASVRENQGLVKIISRRLLKLANLREYNRLKQQESRERRAVKIESNASSKDIELRKNQKESEKKDKKEKTKKEEPASQGAKPPAPAKKKKADRDERIDHPAIKAVVEVMAQYPVKDLWNRIIREIGDKPDLAFLTACYETWRGFNGNKQNLEEWLFTPHKTGKLPTRFTEQRNGTGSKQNNPGNSGDRNEQRINERREIVDQLLADDLAEQGLPS
jgi:hypothetical protein